MGFLSGLLGAVAAPFTGGSSLLATGLDIAGSMISSNQQNKANQAAQNIAWDRTMNASNTSYQRAVADMRAAGLNPILAYSQGGASTPTAQAAGAVAPDFSTTGTKTANTAMAMASNKANLAKTAQDTVTSAANAELASQNAEAQRLNNEGLRVLPPQVRALGQMANNTGSSVVASAHLLKPYLDKFSAGPSAADKARWNSNIARDFPDSKFRHK